MTITIQMGGNTSPQPADDTHARLMQALMKRMADRQDAMTNSQGRLKVEPSTKPYVG